MIAVNSINRGAAKKLLTLLGHAAVTVRNMTVRQLTDAINRSINEGLITTEGANRALDMSPEKRPPNVRDNGKDAPKPDDGDDTNNSGGDGENGEGEQGENGEGESEAEQGDDDADDGEGYDGDEGNPLTEVESEEDDGDDMQEQRDDDAPQENDDDGEGDDDSEGEGDDDEEPVANCDCCDKECMANELSAGAEGTPYEGEALCEDCDALNNEPDREIEHSMLDVVLKYIRAGLNVALVGPAGTGKSYMARQVARKLDRDFHVNGAMLSKYDLIGYCDAGGTYHSTPAHDAFVNGGVHCFDELDASAPDAVVAFNGMTDDQPFYTFPNGQQDQHKDYVAIACMNTYGNGANADYVGRYKQDAAAMSRFVKVFIDYSPEVERMSGKKDIVQRVQAVRTACAALSIRHIVSTRMIIQANAARGQKVTKSEIDRDIIFAGLDANAVKQIKAQMKKDAAVQS